ncbi:sensor histidine kinase [Bernardetia sp.]|uniref:sensor histidine kinase n=1 Tax=Bernardetia sp. TaxID=1937974 RepID=UPI0025BC40F7|nr:HAMP domain-containing sensor histidine kinase [Bernardetia sp.]
MFEKEQRIAERAQLLLNENLTSEEWKNAYAHLALDYADLLSDMKFLTKISDRLHNKLSLINEQAIKHSTELENAKRMIAIQNEELKKKISQRTSDVRNAYSQLLATHSELDQFVYRASHDLKGPIARLLGLCQVANIEVKDPLAREYLEKIGKTSFEMGNILESLLYINALKNEVAEPSSFDVVEEVRKMYKALGFLSNYSKIDFDLETEIEKVFFHTDIEIFKTIIKNLLEFAIKHIDDKANRKSYIHLQIFQKSTDLEIIISYNGIEIPSSNYHLIFNLFHKIANIDETTGTELYTTQLAAYKLHGSVILLESTREKTTFSLHLPSFKKKMLVS